MDSQSFSKAWFFVSLGVLVFMYGVVVGKWRYPPYYLLDRAFGQAKTVYRTFTSPPSVSLYNQVHDSSGAHVRRPDNVQPGLTLVVSSWKNEDGWAPGIRLIDRQGEVLHRWSLDRRKIFGGGASRIMDPRLQGINGKDIHGMSLLPDGDIVVNLSYVGMVRLNACGETEWTMKEGNHHSIEQAEEGAFWVPAVYQNRRAGSDKYPDGFPGLGGKPVWVDRVLRVSEDGEILEDLTVLDILYENDLERYIPKVLGGKRPTPGKIPEDLTHINDAEPLSPAMADEYPLFEAGDLVVSLRGLSLVFVFDPETGEVKWHASDPFIYQHDPDFIGDGWIGVFDNNYDLTERGSMLGGSRIVAMQPHTDSVEVRFPTRHSEPFYTHVQGKWQQLENGNMLLTEAVAGRIVEVDSKGRTVWEWIHSPTDDAKVPAVRGRRVQLTKEEIAAWPCSSIDSTRTSTQKPSLNQ